MPWIYISCEEIPAWRLFPERGGFNRQGPDSSWLKERGNSGGVFRGSIGLLIRLSMKMMIRIYLHHFLEPGFGGCERISHLREMLCHFKRLGVGDLTLSEWPNVAMSCP